MQTVNIDVVLRHYVAPSVVEAMSSVTVVKNDDPITADELLNEFVPSEVIAGIDRSELIKEGWPDHDVFNARLTVFNTRLAVLNTLLVIMQVFLAVLQQFVYS